MTVAYLHVGMDRTGSTSLQRFLATAEPQLREQGFLYPTVEDPEFGSITQHAVLTSLLVSEEHIPGDVLHLFRRHEAAFFFANDWLQHMARMRCDAGPKLILSSEAFYSLPFYGILNLANLARRLGYPDVVVPVFIDTAANRYRGQTVQRIVTGRSILPPHPQQVAHYVRRLVSVFGQDAVKVIDFRAACQTGGTVQHSLDIMGIRRPEMVLETREKASLSAEALHLIHSRYVAAALPDAAAKALRTRTALLDLSIDGRSSPTLRPEIAAAIDARSTDYTWLAEQYGFSMPAAIDQPAPPLPDTVSVPDLFKFDAARYRILANALQS